MPYQSLATVLNTNKQELSPIESEDDQDASNIQEISSNKLCCFPNGRSLFTIAQKSISNLFAGICRGQANEKVLENEEPYDIAVLGGFRDIYFYAYNEISVYDSSLKVWSESPLELPFLPILFGAVCLRKELFVFGNFDGSASRSTFQLDGARMKWIPKGSLNEDRWFIDHSSLVFEDRIWVFGGWNYPKSLLSLNSVERYDPEKDKWEFMPPLQIARDSASAVVIDSKIYVCGGSQDREGGVVRYLHSVECLDPAAGVWTLIQPMPEASYGFAAISNGSEILVFGGNGTQKTTNFCLDVAEENARWQGSETRLRTNRYWFSVAHVGRQHFALAGCGAFRTDQENVAMTSMEKFDGRTWSSAAPLLHPSFCHSSTAIPRGLAQKMARHQRARIVIEQNKLIMTEGLRNVILKKLERNKNAAAGE